MFQETSFNVCTWYDNQLVVKKSHFRKISLPTLFRFINRGKLVRANRQFSHKQLVCIPVFQTHTGEPQIPVLISVHSNRPDAITHCSLHHQTKMSEYLKIDSHSANQHKVACITRSYPEYYFAHFLRFALCIINHLHTFGTFISFVKRLKRAPLPYNTFTSPIRQTPNQETKHSTLHFKLVKSFLGQCS